MRALIVLLLSGVLACSDDSGGGADAGDGSGTNKDRGITDGPYVPGDATVEPVEPAQFTYTLEQSTTALPLWTTPCTRKVRTADRAPAGFE